MSSPAAVWIDHEHARVFHMTSVAFDESTVKSPTHKIASGRTDKGPLPEQKLNFEAVAKAVGEAAEALMVEPSEAKLAFLRFAQTHDANLAARIVGVETVDQPTDGALIKHVRA